MINGFAPFAGSNYFGSDMAYSIRSDTGKQNVLCNYAGYRECHITPDWLLIYEIDENDLYLERTGTHPDVFR